MRIRPTSRAVAGAPTTSGRGLPTLTALRALAAGVVFVHHLPDSVVPLGLGSVGYAAVPFFFVLSGFVLTWSAAGTRGFGPFMLRRVARIYPSHLFVAGVLLVGPLMVQFSTPASDLAAIALVQPWIPNLQYAYALDGVTWSLGCEMVFYLLFVPLTSALNRLSPRAVIAVALLAQAVVGPVIFAAAASPTESALFAVGNTDPLVHLPSFLLGIAGARWLKEGRAVHVRWASVAAAAALVAAALMPARPLLDLWLPPVFLLLILLVARRDAAGRPLAGGRAAVYAGEVSFAFYLVHQPVLINVERAWGSGFGQYAAALAISVVCAVALHHLVERPAHRVVLIGAERLRGTWGSMRGRVAPRHERKVEAVAIGQRS